MIIAGLVTAAVLAASGGATDLPGIPAADRAVVTASAGWQRLTRRPVAALRGLGGAHPGEKVIRVNRTRGQLTDSRGRQRFPYPLRTTVVKTGVAGGRVSLVAIMRRVARGDAPSAWRYVEYTRDPGTRAFSRVGGGQSLCSDCHMAATRIQRSDAVFTRLAPAP
ncbi:MAG TPA: hypothetical protein PKD59_01075 [Miltoncostaeaceae bacterium]|nr:hypothetical protein [Miltoncostaeaceae bacterium]